MSAPTPCPTCGSCEHKYTKCTSDKCRFCDKGSAHKGERCPCNPQAYQLGYHEQQDQNVKTLIKVQAELRKQQEKNNELAATLARVDEYVDFGDSEVGKSMGRPVRKDQTDPVDQATAALDKTRLSGEKEAGVPAETQAVFDLCGVDRWVHICPDYHNKRLGQQRRARRTLQRQVREKRVTANGWISNLWQEKNLGQWPPEGFSVEPGEGSWDKPEAEQSAMEN